MNAARARAVGAAVEAARAAVLAAAATVVAGCAGQPGPANANAPAGAGGADAFIAPCPHPSTPTLWGPRSIHAPRAAVAPVLDGRGDDEVWSRAQWSDDFVDIEGPARAVPSQRTRVKLAWDGTALFILAELQERDLWATLRNHDEIVFQDNDFEVFIDPDGDCREYYEIEVNALGTLFDLYLPVPYRAGAKANHGWDAPGLQQAIRLEGTLNDNRDIDTGWTVEMALPWTMFEPVGVDESGARVATHQRTPRPPAAGTSWRINFSRVQWQLERDGTGYRKVAGRSEDNWVWTPQWIIDMHVPQWWGRVWFDPAPAGAAPPAVTEARSP